MGKYPYYSFYIVRYIEIIAAHVEIARFSVEGVSFIRGQRLPCAHGIAECEAHCTLGFGIRIARDHVDTHALGSHAMASAGSCVEHYVAYASADRVY